jgi:hypothetical protein
MMPKLTNSPRLLGAVFAFSTFAAGATASPAPDRMVKRLASGKFQCNITRKSDVALILGAVDREIQKHPPTNRVGRLSDMQFYSAKIDYV